MDDKDLAIINSSIKQLQKSYDQPIAIEVEAIDNFTRAEEYHQNYLDKNPGGYCHISNDLFEKAAKATYK